MSKPDDLVELGRITGAYGLKGWVSVQPSSPEPEVLLKAKQWWISRLRPVEAGPAARLRKPSDADLIFEDFRILQVKTHADRLVAHLEGIETRELAEKFKSCRVYVSRARFPAPQAGEFYWVDLIGCRVVNLQGHCLGEVGNVVDHGAHPILEVEGGQQAHLIPFVGVYVIEVDLAARQITVDWQEDYA